MITQEIIRIKKGSSFVLTEKEIEVINKKLLGKKLSQQDSNYLSRYVRPKLKEISSIDAKSLLSKLKYNQKINSIEDNLRRVILKNVMEVMAIVLYGSVIQNNYEDYNDIDILIVTKSNPGNLGKKAEITLKLKKEFQKEGINADIELYSIKTIKENYFHNPSLLYQLQDSKVIYGKMNLPDKRKVIYNIELKMKLDWSDIADIEPEGVDIYKALRNIILVRLLLKKVIDNRKLKESLNDEFGRNLIEKLKSNKESKIERKIALDYLKGILTETENLVKGGSWEKIEL